MPSSPSHIHLRDWGLLVLLSVIWGGSFLFAGIAVKELSPLVIVMARVVIAAAALAVSACGSKTETTVDNTTITDMNATEGLDTMTDNMTAVDGAMNGGMMANDTMMSNDMMMTNASNAM